jgi:hypothetical protein
MRYIASPDIQDLEHQWCCKNTQNIEFALVIFNPSQSPILAKYQKWAQYAHIFLLSCDSLEECKDLAKKSERSYSIWQKGKLINE